MIAAPILALVLLAPSAQQSAKEEPTFGHSKHGAAFDSGLRTRPWRMTEIGKVDLQFTTQSPETAAWLNQGVALVHNFWYEEARRAFRWAHKLEPQNPMVHWGLGFCASKDYDSASAGDFFAEAHRLKATASPREQALIDAYHQANSGNNNRRSRNTLRNALRDLVEKFPHDHELKALLLLETYEQTSAAEAAKLADQIIAVDPLHPAANHLLIHIWDGQDNLRALDACERYAKVAVESGHANHMPGHIYSKVGMWKEAAWAMDKSTRVELKYMNDRLAFPFETWNYSHNRNYLIYIQEQLGMANRAKTAALNLINSPRDPDYNDFRYFGEAHQGLAALVRTLVKFERWDDIRKPSGWAWPQNEMGDSIREEAMAHANIALGAYGDAEKAIVNMEKEEAWGPQEMKTLSLEILRGKLAAARNRPDQALGHYNKAVDAERKLHDRRSMPNDPPFYPLSAYTLRGNHLLTSGEPQKAVPDFQQALKDLPNDAWALAGLAQSHQALGQNPEAEKAAAAFLYVWAEADPALPLLKTVRSLFPEVQPHAETPRPERPYKPADLDPLGPGDWRPFAAPDLRAVDSQNKPVDLVDYRGKNVIVVFYLSDECVHCMEQLVALDQKSKDLAANDTVVLAVSSADPAQNASSEKLKPLGIRLLSDPGHTNARKWASFDDFEDMELHSTVFVDREGKIRWKRTGGEPFSNIDYLLGEIKRVNQSSK